MAASSPDPSSDFTRPGFGDDEELVEFEASTILGPLEELGDPQVDQQLRKRRFPRLLAPPCRPVTARLEPDLPDASPSAWFCADILDIGLGGLCLLITDTQDMRVGQQLTLDFNAHRLPQGLQGHRFLPATLRWFVRSGHVTTMGLGFETPLPEIPELLSERRQQPRNPNLY